MTGALLDLSDIAPDLRLDGHLPECDHAQLDWRDCQWCQWAVSTVQIRSLIDTRHDARALLDRADNPTVAWVVATTELIREFDRIDTAAILVSSVRDLAQGLQRAMTVDLDRLRARRDGAVAADGPIERQCMVTAGAVAAAALQHPRYRPQLEGLHTTARRRLQDLSTQLSEQIQVAALFPVVDHLHWHGLPRLRTQPEWARRPVPGDSGALSSAQLNGTGLAHGSLEALVVEAVVDRVTAELVHLGPELIGAAPPVTLARSIHDRTHSGQTRSLLWRIARIDWHLTFVDTGHATCWNARVDGEQFLTDVPWPVAIAIDAGDQQGLVSATHQERPTPKAGDTVSQSEFGM